MTLSTLLVTPDSSTRKARERRGLPDIVDELVRLGAPAMNARGGSLPVDAVWAVDGKPVMFDLKDPEDLIASADDGRLHSQMTAMQAKNPLVYGFLIEGEWGSDGITIGYGPHAWSYERFDALVLSLQLEGAKIVHSPRRERTPQRLYSLYKWTGKADHGSWHAPSPPHVERKGDYTEEGYRQQVEMLMAQPDMGEKTANLLLDRWPLTEVLGITPEGRAAARARMLSVRGIGPKMVGNWDAWLYQDFSSPLLRAETSSGKAK